MEKSIKRVEKLVHATSSTLAQMKFSLMFDDMNGERIGQPGRKSEDFDVAVLRKFLESNGLNLQQNEFNLEASEALAKMDKILAPKESSRKNMKPLDRIKEINKKMNHLMLEQSKRGETKQSRQKLLSLISEEKFSPGMNSCKESVESKQTARLREEKEPSDKDHPICRKTEPLLTANKSPIVPKVELKNKILETQEIVNRGFQTARQLAQKVESMTKWEKKDKTPSSCKTVSEINLRSLEGKTESNETIKTVKCRRSSRGKKKGEADFRGGEQINTKVIDIKRYEFEKDSRSNLQLQHLPSLHIKGGLKVQKIHNLEIPASEEVLSERINTAISFLSHEQIEREKIEKVLKMRNENCSCLEKESRTKYVECFNCGKMIKIRETWVDPRRIDEVLQKCDFNVFDPKIDEFVEKYADPDAINRCEEIQSAALTQPDADVKAKATKQSSVPEKTEEFVQTIIKEEPKNVKRFTLQDFSDQLCKKYKEEADALADYHLKMDDILRNLFRKVEESKDIFETCQLLKSYKSDSERAQVLTATKPVVITLPKVSPTAKNRQKKLDKKDVKNRSKSRTVCLDDDKFSLPIPPPSKSLKGTEGEGISSLIHSSWNKNSVLDTKEEIQEGHYASSTWKSQVTKQKCQQEAEGLHFVASPLSHSSSSSCKLDSSFKEEKIRDMTYARKKHTKQVENKSRVASSTVKSKSGKSPNSKKVEIEEKGASSVTSSTSSKKNKMADKPDFVIQSFGKSKYLLTPPTQLSAAKPTISDDMENMSGTAPGRKSDRDEEVKAVPSQTSSEKSENNYESDFESLNEPEEKADEHDDEELEQERRTLKKLSTISEVDSELEKKISEEQKTPHIEGDRKGKKEGNTIATGVSSKSKNLEVAPAKTAEASLRSTPSELVTSLRDILTAMQGQFARTESLAEKLTESSRIEKTHVVELIKDPIADATWKMTTPAELVENLQSSRKDLKSKFSLNLTEKPVSGKSKIPERISSADGTSEEGGSSLGEIIMSEGRKNKSGMSSTSSISEESFLNLASEDESSLGFLNRKETINITDLNLVT